MADMKNLISTDNKFRQLTESAERTLMGQLLRQFWQPVCVSNEVASGKAKAVRVFSEDLTVYRGESGTVHVVAGRCAHRATLLHTGWVDGDEIRCMYHGWKYGPDGVCTERPAEKDTGNVRIRSYPVREYGGLIFAFMGTGEPPVFDLPRKESFESEDYLVFAKSQIWPCNWFQQVENSLDAVHVTFVHRWGKVGAFGKAVSTAIPTLDYEETDAGIRQTATRGENNVRVSDWTFPNNNHIIVPGRDEQDPWIENSVWMIPVDDENTMRIQIRSVAKRNPDLDARITDYFNENDHYNPADYHDELFHQKRMPDDTGFELISAQDYVAQVGQGAIADRDQERLGQSDRGIVFLRRLFWREMEKLANGGPMKPWRKLDQPAELPRQGQSAPTN